MGDHERLRFTGFENRLFVLTLQEVNKQQYAAALFLTPSIQTTA